ncbi:MAG: sulfur carrier protein ThiS [Deltaproteobacteria bacterium]|nr:sulfur carrier protein ThiS [Deltaproteobacteria bacterium]
MFVTLNGNRIEVTKGSAIKALIYKLELNEKQIAVEHNGEIVDTDAYSSCILNDDDTVEIVHFVGGG